MLKRHWGNRAGLIISSLLFAAYHLHVVQGGIAFFVGLAAGYLVLASRSLWPAILLHFLHNASVLGVQSYWNGAGLGPNTVFFIAGPVAALAIMMVRYAIDRVGPS